MKEKKVKEKNPLTYLVGMTWRYSEGNRRNVIKFIILFFLAATLDILAMPYAWSLIFDHIQTKGITEANMPELQKLLLLLLGVIVLFWALHGPARVLERTNAYRARNRYVAFLVRGVLGLPVEWHSSHQTGDTMDKVNKGGEALYSFSKDSYRILYEIIKLTGSAGMLIWFFPMSAVFMSILMGGCFIIVTKFDEKLIAQYKEIIKMQNAASALICDVLSNVMTVIILRVEKPVFDSIVHKADGPVALNIENNKFNEIKWFLVGICCTLMTVIVLGGYLYHQVSIGLSVSAGSIFLLYRYLDKVGGVFSNFAGMYGDMVHNKASVMNAEILSRDFTGENLTNHVLPVGWNKISIRNLNFSYENEEGRRHLDGVNLDILRGRKVAFVGKSGCGKSTLLKLIRGLAKPSSLSLGVDGRPVPEGFDGIARAIALIPQAPEVFAGSILSNITLGVECEMADVEKCVRIALFEDTVKKLPSGYDSKINEKGVNLSGGQMQRLALARGLYASQDKSVMLLDEPTSGLDGGTEREVYYRIFAHFSDSAIISAIHRLHLLPMFDTVCFFGDGRIIASGSFDELMQTCPEFRQMYDTYTSSGESDSSNGEGSIDC